MSKHRDRNPAVHDALNYTAGDLADLTRLWPLALEQLHLSAGLPPQAAADKTPEALQARDDLARAERAERVENARTGRPTLGFSPAPLRVAALDDIATAQTLLVELADKVTDLIRANNRDHRPGPHRGRLLHLTGRTVKHRDIDEHGYPLRFGYGRHSVSGRELDLIGLRRDIDMGGAAISWLTRALPAIVDDDLAGKVATGVSRARTIIRGVAGLPDLKVRLTPACFVCHKPALRMNLDQRYIECRNPDCKPTGEQCGFKGPRGEPRWYQHEWPWLSKALGVSLADQLLQMLEEATAS